MRVKTKWLALFLSICMLLLCGCGKRAVNKDESAAVVQETTEPAEESAEPTEETTDPVEETTATVMETQEPAEPTEETEAPAEETAEPAQDTSEEAAAEKKEESTENTEKETVFAASVAEEPWADAETAEDTEPEVSAEPEKSAESEAIEEPVEEAESGAKEPAVTEEEESMAPAEETTAEEAKPAEETVLITEEPEETELEVEEPEVQRTIEITVPAEYADVRYRIGEITWNPDDSVTYRLTEEEHTRLLAEVHSDIQRELNEMCASPYFLDFFSMTANEDCTVFTVVCLSIETTRAEQKSIPQLYEFGKKYAAYEGRESGNIHIDYMNKIGNTFVMRDSERDERPDSSR